VYDHGDQAQFEDGNYGPKGESASVCVHSSITTVHSGISLCVCVWSASQPLET